MAALPPPPEDLVAKMKAEKAAAAKATKKYKAGKLAKVKADYVSDSIKTSIHNANGYRAPKSRKKGADQLPFSATGLLSTLQGDCVGSVIHNVNHAGPPSFYATYVLTAGHCCWDQDEDTGHWDSASNVRFSWVANSRSPKDSIVWNLGPQDLGHEDPEDAFFVSGAKFHEKHRDDWCVICFTNGPSVGRAPAVLHIKYDDGNPLPDGELLWSTYWTSDMDPPNPTKNDYYKKYAQAKVKMIPISSKKLDKFKPGIWKLLKEYTAEGMSGSPFVEATDPNFIRGTLAGSYKSKKRHSDQICRIDEQEFNDIIEVVNTHITEALPDMHADDLPIMKKHPLGSKVSISTAHDFTGDVLSVNSMDKHSEENSNGYGLGYAYHNSHHGSGHNGHGSMELVTNKYYYEYGEHGQDHSANIFSFAMGAIMTIGICCFVMIISIMINLCTCVANIYYTSTNNRHSKHGGNRYNIVNNDVDGDQV